MVDISIIGSGFSGLAAACYAARDGYAVSVHEKNTTVGGRCRHYTEEGFVFDMGPSWYWMPDVFERFFNDFGKSVSDYYDLVQLDPGFKVFYKNADPLLVPADVNRLYDIFEEIEPGSARKLKTFLQDAAYKYQVGMADLVYKPGLSLKEFMRYDVLKAVLRTHLFRSVSSHVHRYFKDQRLVQLMEFPILFLGAMAKDIPALYTLMNHSALVQGTWYPMGGMNRIISGMEQLARELGVLIETDSHIKKIDVRDGKVKGIFDSYGYMRTRAVISSADYHHTEQLLEPRYRNYTDKYWEKKTFAPSCLLYYVGVNKKINNLEHHNLFFDADFDKHAREIYETKEWPENPLFYVCCPSKTDDSVAPAGHENLFILIPIATGIQDTEVVRSRYFPEIIRRIEKHTGDTIMQHVVYNKSYSLNNFISDYNAYKGNAYGLANTLLQTAILKPSLRNNKLSNMIYTGQLTVPGPGVPPSLISGKLAAQQAILTIKETNYEAVV